MKIKDVLKILADEGKFYEAFLKAEEHIRQLEEAVSGIIRIMKSVCTARDQAEDKIKQLEKQKSFLISGIKSGEQLSDNWEKALEEK